MPKRALTGKKKRKVKTEAFDQRAAMIAALAHEIRNPLNSIKGASQYLYDRYSSKKDIREFTGIIIDEINRLDRYLNEFLSFSRGSGINAEKSVPRNFFSGVIMVTKHSMPCEISLSFKTNVPSFYMDHEQVMQVMLNLLSNSKYAVKEVPEPRIEIEVSHDRHFVYVRVKDNGEGIKPENLNRVLLPFYTTKDTGVGIGLSICKTIIKKHRGTLKIKSAPGWGTEIIFSLSRKLKKGLK